MPVSSLQNTLEIVLKGMAVHDEYHQGNGTYSTATSVNLSRPPLHTQQKEQSFDNTSNKKMKSTKKTLSRLADREDERATDAMYDAVEILRKCQQLREDLKNARRAAIEAEGAATMVGFWAMGTENSVLQGHADFARETANRKAAHAAAIRCEFLDTAVARREAWKKAKAVKARAVVLGRRVEKAHTDHALETSAKVILSCSRWRCLLYF